MSEQEAKRIIEEVPTMNLPPDVFIARLNRAENYFKEWYKNRARLAFGRTTTGDVDTMLKGGPEAQTPPPPAEGWIDLGGGVRVREKR